MVGEWEHFPFLFHFFFTLSLSDGPRRAAFGRRKFTTGMMMIVGLSGVGR